MSGFAARGNAVEGSFFRKEQEFALRKQLERLVAEGQLPQSALQQQQTPLDLVANRGPNASTSHVSVSDVPVSVLKGRSASDYVYQHVKGALPVPKPTVSWSTLGTPVSFGRARWTVDDASIFSVDDGKRLAQTPHKPLTFYERIRLEKQQKAAIETPLVKGIRLLPEFTPGRAMLWGSILAVWGTAALVASTAKSLDIKTTEEAAGRLREVIAPMASQFSTVLTPLKSAVSATQMRSERQSELAIRLKAKLASPAMLRRQGEA